MSPVDNSSRRKPKIAVSYSWKEELGLSAGGRGAVDDFCRKLKKRGADIIRDDERIKHGESLRRFMETEITNADRVCIFVSVNYLESPNCMFELCSLWNSTKDIVEDFRRRARICILPGFELATLSQFDQWRKYWGERVANESGPVIDGLKPLVEYIQPVLKYLVDKLYKADVDEFVDVIADDVELRMADPAELARARSLIAQDIEQVLSVKDRLRDLFSRYPTIGRNVDGRFCLSESLKQSSDDVAEILLKLMDDRSIGGLSDQDKEPFLDVVGGIVALGVRPAWLAGQIRGLGGEKRMLDIKVPTPQGELTAAVEIIEGSSNVDLLHLVSRSLLGKCIKVKTLFKVPPKAGADNAPDRVLRSVGEDENVFEIKLHLIKRIAPDSSTGQKPSEDRSQYMKRVDRLFRRVLDKVEFAYREGYPWCLTDPAYFDRINVLRELGLHKVIILIPSEGNLDDFYERFENAISAALKIQKIVEMTQS